VGADRVLIAAEEALGICALNSAQMRRFSGRSRLLDGRGEDLSGLGRGVPFRASLSIMSVDERRF
jgi:hypothetical protein